jgi:hypothetical protein
MGRNRVPGMLERRCNLACCFIAGLILLSGCVTTSTVPEMAWVRTDGRKIADDPALLQQGKSDIAACDANLDSGTPTSSAPRVHGPEGIRPCAQGSGRGRARGIRCRCSTRCSQQIRSLLTIHYRGRARLGASLCAPSIHCAAQSRLAFRTCNNGGDQTQPLSSRMASCQIISVPASLSLRQGMAAKFSPP